MCSAPAGSISVKVRAYVTPSEHVEGFESGKEFPLNLYAGITLEELVQRLFIENRHHIGFKVVNGKVVKDKVLSDGDLIEIYRLMGGG
jgi:sulfur carrier protein ThiS